MNQDRDGYRWDLGEGPKIPCLMGIVNITPDSFSDGGRFLDSKAAIAQGIALVNAGAAILDLGAEASSFFRDGVEPTGSAEQLRRLIPVLEGLRGCGAILSVDTRSSLVAAAALEAGARVINDISAGQHDPEILAVVAKHNAGIILMHMGAEYPKTPAMDDSDILTTVRAALAGRIAAAQAAGIAHEAIAIDPGIGFGKTMRDNWTLALGAQELAILETPVMLGASRKRFLETPPPPAFASRWPELNAQHQRPGDHPRDAATVALTQIALANGLWLHRLHNVALAHNHLLANRTAQMPR